MSLSHRADRRCKRVGCPRLGRCGCQRRRENALAGRMSIRTPPYEQSETQ
jgi:hypothetical protein